MTFVSNGRMKPANDPRWEAGTRILRASGIPPAAWGDVRKSLQRVLAAMTLDQCARLAGICEEPPRTGVSR